MVKESPLAGPLRVAVCGAGFWARFQVAAWRELAGVEVAAICNRTLAKAQNLANEMGIAAVYDDAGAMLRDSRPDVLDIITDVDTHPKFVELAASHGIPVICQKPMAPTIRQAVAMVETCRKAGVPCFVHENWRYQYPLRQLKEVLKSGVLGDVYRARVDFISGFPVFANQPFLRQLRQFILTDIGSHVFDASRFLFGEAKSIYCKTRRVHADIAGEDVATAMLEMPAACVTCNMSYAENPIEHEVFPQTLVWVEASKGTACLAPDYWLRVTTAAGTHSRQVKPPRYAWADPAYDLVHSSIVACNANLLAALRKQRSAETTGEDNLRTMRLVYGAYASAKRGAAVDPAKDDWFDDSLGM